jgi:hypothetical protein
LSITTAFLPLYVFCQDQLMVSYLRPSKIDGAKHAWAILALLVKRQRQAWPKFRIIFRGDSGFCRWWMLSWCERHAVGYIVGTAKNKRLNATTAQRQREAQDCYAALGIKLRWFTEIHYAAGNCDQKRRVIANINNDLTSGKRPIADIESLNSYFRNVLDSCRSRAELWTGISDPTTSFLTGPGRSRRY